VKTEHTGLITLIGALFTACATHQPPRQLVGLWGIRPLPSDAPPACANISTEFRSDGTVLIHSGAETVTANYTTTPHGNRLLLERTNVQTNGEPNCQGRPAQYVVDHFFREAYVELTQDTLKMFTSADAPSPLFVYVRIR
jgi:hypothetical protein